MKNLALILFLISSTYSNGQDSSKVHGGFGIYQNFGSIHAKNENFDTYREGIKRSTLGASAFISGRLQEDWYFEFNFQFSFQNDTSRLGRGEFEDFTFPGIINETKTTQSINRSFGADIAYAYTSNFVLNLLVMRRVSKFLSVGTGAALDLRFSEFQDLGGDAQYNWNESADAYLLDESASDLFEPYEANSFHLVVPIKLRVHIPIAKNELLFNLALNMAQRGNTHINTGIGFRF